MVTVASHLPLQFVFLYSEELGGSRSVVSKCDLTAEPPGEVFQNRFLGFSISGNRCMFSSLPPKASQMITGLDDCKVLEGIILSFNQ